MTRPEPVELFAQADLLLLISRLLGEPSPATVDALAEATETASELLTRAGIVEGTLTLAAIHSAVAPLAFDEWAAEHTRLFSSSIACPANETAYIRREKGPMLADIAGFYQAFGFEMPPSAHEKQDHIRCEIEYFGLLLVALALAVQSGNAEGEAVTRDAMHAFAADHLGVWLPAFCSQLAGATGLVYYTLAAVLLDEAWKAIAERNGLPLNSAASSAEQADDGTPYECGMADSPTG